MPMPNPTNVVADAPGLLDRSLAQLGKAGVVPRAAAALERNLPAVLRSLVDLIIAEVPAYSSSHNPEILPSLEQHARAHLLEICRLCSGGKPGGLAFVKTHARQRAAQRFPLEAMLHAYRCGQPVLLRWLQDAVTESGARPRQRTRDAQVANMTVADFAIDYTHAVSAIATSEYVAHTRQVAEAEGDLRTELMTILLSGYDESDGRVARLLRRAGYLEQRQSYCVVVAQAVNPAEMEHPERSQRILNAISAQVAATSMRQLAAVRNNLVTFVLSDSRRQSGWTASRGELAARIEALLQTLGPSVLVGISADHPSTSFLPKALHEASLALDLAGVSQRLVRFSQVPVRAMLVHRGAEALRSAAPAWSALLLQADEKAGGALLQTLRAMAQADLNVQKAARELGKHPNTLYARLERIRDLTGLDGQRFTDLTELLLTADCLERGKS